MVESLRRSVEQLEPPGCPNCHIEMKRYRSVRVAGPAIDHYFQCTNCNRLTEIKVMDKGDGNEQPPPHKLSRPRDNLSHAA